MMSEQSPSPQEVPLLSPEADLLLYEEFFTFRNEHGTLDEFLGDVAVRLVETVDEETRPPDPQFSAHLFKQLVGYIENAPVKWEKLYRTKKDTQFLRKCELFAEILHAGLLLPHEELVELLEADNPNLRYCEALVTEVNSNLPQLNFPSVGAVISTLRGGSSGYRLRQFTP